MAKMTVRDIEVSDKKILIRVDFNVPIDENDVITDDSRIRAALPTIRYLIERRAKIILISHLGRPGGKVVDELRLTGVAQRVSQILGRRVGVATNCIGPEVEDLLENMRGGDIVLLENLRFHPDEETGSALFAQALARLGDIFVNDAFGTSHRAHASVAVIANYLPAVAGLLLEEEIKNLGGILKHPAHPFASLLGGAKVSDKVGMLENIMGKVDSLLIGGGMAATFLKAESYGVGLSLIELDRLDTVARLIEKAIKSGVHLLLPVDVIITDEGNLGSKVETASIENIPDDKRIVDIGPQTVKNFHRELQDSKTVFWNGPMGIHEIPHFAEGTKAMARLLADLDATTIVGGGSTAEVINDMGLAGRVTFVSTGGGAALRFLSGEILPGVEVLLDKEVGLAVDLSA